jgi:inner membrane protein
VDNLTHTLAGMLLAEVAVQMRARRNPQPSASFRTAAYLASVFANNAPDLDFVYARITDPPLGYLLHHRGHSHTVPVGIAIGVMTVAVVAAAARRWRVGWSPADLRSVIALSCLGPLVHMAMDFSNNYGVHPFWPAYSGWIYGDAVFIVEPFFWAVSVPSLAFAARSRAARLALATIVALGVALCWVGALAPREEARLLPVPMAFLVTLVTLGSTLAAWRAGPRARIAFGVLGSWTVATVFFTASSLVAAKVRSSPLLAGAAVHDVVITPMPANPLCATVLVVTTRDGDYIVKRATVATMPALLSSERCPTAADGSPTAPRTAIVDPPSDGVRWKDEFRAPLRELVELERDNCQAAAFFRFARVPYWTKTIASDFIVGDLRFDRSPGLDFSDIRVDARPTKCPKAVPPWLPPRSDLLDSHAR